MIIFKHWAHFVQRASAVIVRQDPKHTGFGTDSIGAQRQFPVALADEKSAAGPGNPDLSLVLDFHEYCAGHAKLADQMKMPVQQPITVALPNNQNVRTHYFLSLAHHVVIFFRIRTGTDTGASVARLPEPGLLAQYQYRYMTMGQYLLRLASHQ